jgi:hypothetical protein
MKERKMEEKGERLYQRGGPGRGMERRVRHGRRQGETNEVISRAMAMVDKRKVPKVTGSRLQMLLAYR